MVGDAIEDAMDDEEDEEETEGIVNKVLDEIGITMGDGFVAAPQSKVRFSFNRCDRDSVMLTY